PGPSIRRRTGTRDSERQSALQDGNAADLPASHDVAHRAAMEVLAAGSERQQIGRSQVHSMTRIAVRAGPVSAAVAGILRDRTIIAAVAAEVIERVRPRPVTQEIEAIAEALFERCLHRGEE